MDRDKLYEILDIESPDEFEYYENLSALLEADEMIDSDLILALLKEIELEKLADMLESYFDEWEISTNI